MKKLSVILLAAATMICGRSLWAQQPGQPANIPGVRPSAERTGEPELSRFDLDFRGGTPAELVKAIEQSSGKPLNVIIPDEPDVKATHIPPLILKSITVSELFSAMTPASSKLIRLKTGDGGSVQAYSNYGFRTEGRPREDSIWYFRVESPTQSPMSQSIRFFQLEPYLQTYKVEDITTAIETGWKMLGEEPYPKLSFHKDTKLLIAVGDPHKLASIEAVLSQLTKDKPAAEKVPSSDKSNEPPKRQ